MGAALSVLAKVSISAREPPLIVDLFSAFIGTIIKRALVVSGGVASGQMTVVGPVAKVDQLHPVRKAGSS